jgi:tRNA1Val (adenine37-N6)-methyltransferase
MSRENNPEDNPLTVDQFLGGTIVCRQNRAGYRFSVDPVLLSHFVEVKEDDILLDLGTGCGIMQLIILSRHFETIRRIDGIEIQRSLCELAAQNIAANNFDKRADVIEGDVKNISLYFQAENYDRIICNPPYFPAGSGRRSGNVEAEIARHQIMASLADFLAATAYCLKNRGSAYYVYPAHLLSSLLLCAARFTLEIKRLRFIYSYPDNSAKARLVLVKMAKNGRTGLEVDPPFYIYEERNGPYSKAMAEFYAPV